MKKKEGLSRLLEIAGEKKSLLLFSGLFSAMYTYTILVYIWNIKGIACSCFWFIYDRFWANDQLGVACFYCFDCGCTIFVCGINVISHSRLSYFIWVKNKTFRAYRSVVFGIFKFDIYRLYKENHGTKCRKNRAFYSSHYSRFGECVCNHNFYVYYLFFFKWLDGIHRSIMHTFKYRNAIF